MRVLWVSTQLPHPRAGAGEQLEFELLRVISQKHDAHVVTSALSPGQINPDLAALGVTQTGVAYTPTPRPRNRLQILWQLAARGADVAFWGHGDRARALSDAVSAVQAERPFDVVQVVMGDTAPVLRVASHPRFLLLFDVFVHQIGRELANAPRMRDRVRWASHLRKVRRWEERWYPLADAIACNSPVDAEVAAGLLSRPVDVIPNPIGDRYFEPPSVGRSRNIVTFIGTLCYRPNVDAVERLTKEIWPRVRSQVPDAELRIVGRQPVREVYEAVEGVGAVFADVEDVRPFYWESAVVVAPIQLGSGLRNKPLHALATETPFVTTPTTLEGLPRDIYECVITADTPIGFADAVVGVLRQPDTALAKARVGRTVVERFRPANVGGALERWWFERAPALTATHR